MGFEGNRAPRGPQKPFGRKKDLKPGEPEYNPLAALEAEVRELKDAELSGMFANLVAVETEIEAGNATHGDAARREELRKMINVRRKALGRDPFHFD